MAAAPPRQPTTFRERVLFQFRSAENARHLEYEVRRRAPPGSSRLQFLLQTLPSAVYHYGATDGMATDVLDSDPLAVRGSASRSLNLGEELSHLNASFLRQRLAEAARLYPDTRPRAGGMAAASLPAPAAGDAYGSEPLHYQMFVADSLRPPGLEGLNSAGPLWELHENQRPSPAAGGFGRELDPQVGLEDSPWAAASGRRTAEQAVAEYYGVDSPMAANMGIMPTLEAAQRSHGPTYSQIAQGMRKEAWASGASVSGFEHWFGRGSGSGVNTLAGKGGGGAGGGRFQRREEIPYWQRPGGRPEILEGRWQSGADGGSFEEGLGAGSAEFGGERENPIRGWDMSRLRHPHGQSYTKLGPRHPGP